MGQDFIVKVPSFLVAMPQLQDPNFHQTVVLLLNYDSTGAFGIVVNRSADMVMGALEIKERTLPPELAALPVWYGGPVEQERIMFLVQGATQPASSVRVSENTYLGSTLEFIAEKVRTKESQWNFRAYSGYSGWGQDQLTQELAVSSWLLAPFDPKILFETPPEQMWSCAVQSIGLDPSQLATETSTTLQ